MLDDDVLGRPPVMRPRLEEPTTTVLDIPKDDSWKGEALIRAERKKKPLSPEAIKRRTDDAAREERKNKVEAARKRGLSITDTARAVNLTPGMVSRMITLLKREGRL